MGHIQYTHGRWPGCNTWYLLSTYLVHKDQIAFCLIRLGFRCRMWFSPNLAWLLCKKLVTGEIFLWLPFCSKSTLRLEIRFIWFTFRCRMWFWTKFTLVTVQKPIARETFLWLPFHSQINLRDLKLGSYSSVSGAECGFTPNLNWLLCKNLLLGKHSFGCHFASNQLGDLKLGSFGSVSGTECSLTPNLS